MKEPLPALLALLIIGKVGASIDKQWQAWHHRRVAWEARLSHDDVAPREAAEAAEREVHEAVHLVGTLDLIACSAKR